MSLYALFPPIETCPAKDSLSASGGGSSSSISFQPQSVPLHYYSETGGSFSTLLKASVDRFVPHSLIHCQENGKKSKDCMMGIEVKEAKIDPVLLVQSVAGCSSSRQNGKKQQIRRRSAAERESSQHMRPPLSCPTSTRSIKNTSSSGSSNHRSTPTNPHEDAIKFELSISFNGRNYEATRTLQCIMQLRDDLVREMKNKRRWLHSERTSAISDTPESSSCLDESADFVEIPEIPPLNQGGGSGGFVGRGFTMLHAVLSSYCPTLERWLGNVMAIVPQDSECLTNFLWEPISKEAEIDLRHSMVSLEKLGSIKELAGDECSTDDDDSEDEWEG